MKPPTLPQLGTITVFSYGDGIGRIKVDDGTELKVGVAGLKGIVDFSGEERRLVGVRVKVEVVAPHPLGGFRAMKLSRAGKEISFKRVSSPAQWESKLREAGLSAAHAARVRAAIRPAGQLSLKKGSIAPGASKLGGRPDLPADFVWPMSGDQPLAFVGQLKLSELPTSLTTDLALPRKGRIAFFIGTARGSDDPVGRAIVVLGASKKRAAAAAFPDTPTFDARAVVVTNTSPCRAGQHSRRRRRERRADLRISIRGSRTSARWHGAPSRRWLCISGPRDSGDRRRAPASPGRLRRCMWNDLGGCRPAVLPDPDVIRSRRDSLRVAVRMMPRSRSTVRRALGDGCYWPAHVIVTCRAGIGEAGGAAPTGAHAIYDGDGTFSMDVGDPSRRDDSRSELADAKTSDQDTTPGCRLSSTADQGTLVIWDTAAVAYEIVVTL